MNLAFETVSGNHFVDFPFQTPTKLSYAVYGAKTTADRMRLIEEQLIAWKWDDHEIHDMMMEIHGLMRDPTLRLIVV